MKINSKLLISLVAATCTASAIAAESVTSTATVVVQNAFVLTENQALNFGTIRAKADTSGSTTASLIIPADGSAHSVTRTGNSISQSNIIEITAGAPATYSVSSAAPLTNLTITLPTTAIALTNNNSVASFTMGSFGAYITSGANSGSAYSASNLQTDANGAVNFSVGATLTTDGSTPAADYTDGTFTGTYTITVSY
ncbi:DUF4402 domain-containing protein [Maribrevibacterium harenarium]|uniref:DUF4402 domain-containing protein n=1 Tax=Maribrevibacterium harenarium TaxID=2589817 RepID=A0A501X210_9GAMM|nr:DUF4402 domain-containing protein [Maribrevibacterium harenarium]TPE54519.1 DUF4402 domain-containing protein [Maribrevibacterium harenarium]